MKDLFTVCRIRESVSISSFCPQVNPLHSFAPHTSLHGVPHVSFCSDFPQFVASMSRMNIFYIFVLVFVVIFTRLWHQTNWYHFNECVHFRTNLFDSKGQSYLLTPIAIKFDKKSSFVLITYWLNRIVQEMFVMAWI